MKFRTEFKNKNQILLLSLAYCNFCVGAATINQTISSRFALNKCYQFNWSFMSLMMCLALGLGVSVCV